MAAASAIQARGLTKRYAEVRAVDGIDLDVRAGEVYAFLGRNGAGKTTTIRMLLGLIAPDRRRGAAARRAARAERAGVRARRLPRRDRDRVPEPHRAREPRHPATSHRRSARRRRRRDRAAAARASTRTGARDGSRSATSSVSRSPARCCTRPTSSSSTSPPTRSTPPASSRSASCSARWPTSAASPSSSRATCSTEVAQLADRLGVIHEGRMVAELDRGELDGADPRVRGGRRVGTRRAPASCSPSASASRPRSATAAFGCTTRSTGAPRWRASLVERGPRAAHPRARRGGPRGVLHAADGRCVDDARRSSSPSSSSCVAARSRGSRSRALSLGPLGIALFMWIVREPGRAAQLGLLGTKASLAGLEATWPCVLLDAHARSSASAACSCCRSSWRTSSAGSTPRARRRTCSPCPWRGTGSCSRSSSSPRCGGSRSSSTVLAEALVIGTALGPSGVLRRRWPCPAVGRTRCWPRRSPTCSCRWSRGSPCSAEGTCRRSASRSRCSRSGNLFSKTGWAVWFPWSIVPLLVGMVGTPASRFPRAATSCWRSRSSAGSPATIAQLRWGQHAVATRRPGPAVRARAERRRAPGDTRRPLAPSACGR